MLEGREGVVREPQEECLCGEDLKPLDDIYPCRYQQTEHPYYLQTTVKQIQKWVL